MIPSVSVEVGQGKCLALGVGGGSGKPSCPIWSADPFRSFAVVIFEDIIVPNQPSAVGMEREGDAFR